MISDRSIWQSSSETIQDQYEAPLLFQIVAQNYLRTLKLVRTLILVLWTHTTQPDLHFHNDMCDIDWRVHPLQLCYNTEWWHGMWTPLPFYIYFISHLFPKWTFDKDLEYRYMHLYHKMEISYLISVSIRFWAKKNKTLGIIQNLEFIVEITPEGIMGTG